MVILNINVYSLRQRTGTQILQNERSQAFAEFNLVLILSWTQFDSIKIKFNSAKLESCRITESKYWDIEVRRISTHVSNLNFFKYVGPD